MIRQQNISTNDFCSWQVTTSLQGPKSAATPLEGSRSACALALWPETGHSSTEYGVVFNHMFGGSDHSTRMQSLISEQETSIYATYGDIMAQRSLKFCLRACLAPCLHDLRLLCSVADSQPPLCAQPPALPHQKARPFVANLEMDGESCGA